MKNLIMIKQKVDGIQIDGDSSKGISMKKSQELVESEGYTEQNNKESVRQWALLHAFFDYLNRCCHLHCLNWVKMMDRVNDCTGLPNY